MPCSKQDGHGAACSPLCTFCSRQYFLLLLDLKQAVAAVHRPRNESAKRSISISCLYNDLYLYNSYIPDLFISTIKLSYSISYQSLQLAVIPGWEDAMTWCSFKLLAVPAKLDSR